MWSVICKCFSLVENTHRVKSTVSLSAVLDALMSEGDETANVIFYKLRMLDLTTKKKLTRLNVYYSSDNMNIHGKQFIYGFRVL